MQQDHRVGDVVKRQSSSPEIQIHAHPAGAGGRHGYALLIVLKRTGRVGAVQTPRLGVVAQLAVAPSSTPANVFVADADGNSSGAAPLHLPVAAAGHPGAAQHLGPAGEASRVIRVGLRLGTRGHLSAAFGEAEIRVGRVWVRAYVAVIWTVWLSDIRRRQNSGGGMLEIYSHCRKSALVFGSKLYKSSGAVNAGQDGC